MVLTRFSKIHPPLQGTKIQNLSIPLLLKMIKEPSIKITESLEVGLNKPLFLIAGPCVIEIEDLVLDVAGKLSEITQQLGIPFIFKASFDKANRTSHLSYRGPGIEKGLAVLE